MQEASSRTTTTSGGGGGGGGGSGSSSPPIGAIVQFVGYVIGFGFNVLLFAQIVMYSKKTQEVNERAAAKKK